MIEALRFGKEEKICSFVSKIQ